MSSNVMPLGGFSKKQLAEALDAVMCRPGVVNDKTEAPASGIGSTLSAVPQWVFESPEWLKEYDRLKVKHAQWWNYVPGFKKQPSDDATKVIAAINTMRALAKRRHAEAKALDSQWRFLDNALKSNEAIFVD